MLFICLLYINIDNYLILILNLIFYYFCDYLKEQYLLFVKNGDWGLGIGDWGLGIGDWAQSPIPNPQSPIPNPHKISF